MLYKPEYLNTEDIFIYTEENYLNLFVVRFE